MVHAQDLRHQKKRAIPLRDSDVWGSQELLVAWFLVLATGATEHIHRSSPQPVYCKVSRIPVLECSVYTSLFSPLAVDTQPEAPSKTSTRLPISTALGLLPPGRAVSAALVGRGPVGSVALVEQQPASPSVGSGGVHSTQTTTALCDGGEMLARRTCMNAVLERPVVLRAMSKLWATSGCGCWEG